MPKKIIVILSLMSLAAGYGLAQTNCPFGLTDDPAPGQCGRYVDANSDNLCDLSQDLAQSGGASAGEPGDSTLNEGPGLDVESTDTDHNKQTPQEPESGATSQPELQNVPEAAQGEQTETMAVEQPGEKPLKMNRPNYHPWLLLFMVSVLAIAGEIWQRQDSKKIILIQTAWNWMLLGSFFASSLTGLYFILPPGSRPVIAFNLSYWHTITGLIFIYIGLYHAIRRAACLVRGSKTCVKKTPCC
jgi:hypothetical protein